MLVLGVTGGGVLEAVFGGAFIIAALGVGLFCLYAIASGIFEFLLDVGAFFILVPALVIVGIVWLLVEVGVLTGW